MVKSQGGVFAWPKGDLCFRLKGINSGARNTPQILLKSAPSTSARPSTGWATVVRFCAILLPMRFRWAQPLRYWTRSCARVPGTALAISRDRGYQYGTGMCLSRPCRPPPPPPHTERHTQIPCVSATEQYLSPPHVPLSKWGNQVRCRPSLCPSAHRDTVCAGEFASQGIGKGGMAHEKSCHPSACPMCRLVDGGSRTSISQPPPPPSGQP